MGIELDVLVGHAEHELIFVGIQVAKAAGLRDYSGSVMAYRQSKVGKDGPRFTIGSFMEDSSIKVPEDYRGQRLRSTTAMMTEPQTYQMLLRGNCAASEPFRKWVTEEVLPTIRKTGKYDAESSTNPIAMGLMDELKALRGASVREKQGARWVLALENSRRDAAV